LKAVDKEICHWSLEKRDWLLNLVNYTEKSDPLWL
jgi:hypothetical protein